MSEIEVAIVRITDDAFPGFVECKLVDGGVRLNTSPTSDSQQEQ